MAMTTHAPHLTVVRGDPDPEDLAALIGVLIGSGRSGPDPVDPSPLRAGWDRAYREVSPQAGSWRSPR
ncbi:acyl-CoA carboxylase subunit epsilon [Streptomyces sp. HC44]|uniref:Acyl-CoA carboxylase subunit epsilon n=2 Tax=Streptomyces scabichelini TaxID=2711217 RepID=A0A6G4VEZ2_9ACTN|nr:acyl-CoA carboxylase subunit epsilon [Streptomyces scabichelini]